MKWRCDVAVVAVADDDLEQLLSVDGRSILYIWRTAVNEAGELLSMLRLLLWLQGCWQAVRLRTAGSPKIGAGWSPAFRAQLPKSWRSALACGISSPTSSKSRGLASLGGRTGLARAGAPRGWPPDWVLQRAGADKTSALVAFLNRAQQLPQLLAGNFALPTSHAIGMCGGSPMPDVDVPGVPRSLRA